MKNITINPRATIRQAMKKLSKEGEKCLVITDDKNKLLGTLSDGDIRKGIIKGASISDLIEPIYQKNPVTLKEKNYNIETAKKLFIKYKFDIIPLVNDNSELKNIIFINSIVKKRKSDQEHSLNIPVVIMAGGRGTRLKPFTNILPKPLVPVHEKPIIEHIIDSFSKTGVSKFFITVNYKAKLLKAYFDDLNPIYSVDFIKESIPLGTAGSLKLLEGKIKTPFFVTNCDVIIKSDYHSLYEFHIKGNYDITLVASAKEYIIPYGTCELDENGFLANINEKPSYDFLVNTGLYILNPDIINVIPKNKIFHITSLIDKIIKLNKKVGVYPIDEDSWLDIGQWAEYKKTIKKL
tara:strand:- start:5569 stop:6618 length:1050 start_codon:yes stop_codon:yes gene_type:complete